MSKHTPGPWRVGGQGRIYCPEGWYVATVYESVYEGVNQANARLIAAAPELLETLEQIVPESDDWWCPTCQVSLSDVRVTHDEHCDACGTYLGDINTPEWVTQARALIAKVRGD